MSIRTIQMTDTLYQYLLNVSLREAPALKQLRDVTYRMPGSEMQIAPEQGQFMTLLIELIGARKTLEVGTFTGYSAAVVAMALPNDGKVITCDIDKTTTAVAQQFWQQAGVAHKIDLRIAPALETLDELLAHGNENSFDFAFIDADKENYGAYYEKCLQLLRKGGLIAIDNTLWSGAVADLHDQEKSTVAIRALNDKLHHDTRVTLSLVPIGDGLTLARKR